MHTDLNDLIQPVVKIAADASAAIMDIYTTDYDVEIKDDKSPLTAADRASHNCIVAALEALTPETPILSEESAQADWSVRSGWEEYWLIDPLDGTKEFIKRNGEFTVNIALIQQHKAVLGVVYVPAQSRCYFGYQGGGAFEQADGVKAQPISVVQPAQAPVRVVGSRSHRGASLDAYLERLGSHEMVPMGSSLKLCLIASGAADIYPRLGPTSEWDTAAAQAVVECAGGQVVTTANEPLLYNAKADILNPEFLVFGDSTRDWTRYLTD